MASQANARTSSRISLSASTLRLYRECPRCFWRHLNQGVERPRGPFPSLPSGMDAVLKRYFDTYRKQGTLPPLIDGKLRGTLMSGLLNLEFVDPDGEARLFGKLDDCLVLPDGRHAPLDHKTRASAPEGVAYTEKYYQLQMDVYSLLLQRNGYPISRTAVVVYYYPQPGALHEGFPFGVAIHEVATDPDSASRIFEAARALLGGPMPNAGRECEYCQWLTACQTRPHAD